MDIQWGYNNIHIKEGDEWKATFITPYGLYKPTVMFFGQCNSPPTFQAFMDSTFRDMIMEGWLIIYSGSKNYLHVCTFCTKSNIPRYLLAIAPNHECMK